MLAHWMSVYFFPLDWKPQAVLQGVSAGPSGPWSGDRDSVPGYVGVHLPSPPQQRLLLGQHQPAGVPAARHPRRGRDGRAGQAGLVSTSLCPLCLPSSAVYSWFQTTASYLHHSFMAQHDSYRDPAKHGSRLLLKRLLKNKRSPLVTVSFKKQKKLSVLIFPFMSDRQSTLTFFFFKWVQSDANIPHGKCRCSALYCIDLQTCILQLQ